MADSPGQVSSIAIVAVGGGFGAALRYTAALLVASIPSSFPWATLCVNVVGCALAGVLIALIGFDPSGATSDSYLRLLLLVGVLGGFTTFSAFSVEVLALLSSGSTLKALVYIAASNVVALTVGGIAYLAVSRI